MRSLTNDEYYLLKTGYKDAITLADNGILINGIDNLIPVYEDVAGVKMNTNCSSCKLDMMVILSIQMRKYEKEMQTKQCETKTKLKQNKYGSSKA